MKSIIYRCAKKQDMYLYVLCNDDGESDLENLPEALLMLTGKLEQAMALDLTAERKLARADVVEVMRSLEEQGFYLQMPPDVLNQTVKEKLSDLNQN